MKRPSQIQSRVLWTAGLAGLLAGILGFSGLLFLQNRAGKFTGVKRDQGVVHALSQSVARDLELSHTAGIESLLGRVARGSSFVPGVLTSEAHLILEDYSSESPLRFSNEARAKVLENPPKNCADLGRYLHFDVCSEIVSASQLGQTKPIGFVVGITRAPVAVSVLPRGSVWLGLAVLLVLGVALVWIRRAFAKQAQAQAAFQATLQSALSDPLQTPWKVESGEASIDALSEATERLRHAAQEEVGLQMGLARARHSVDAGKRIGFEVRSPLHILKLLEPTLQYSDIEARETFRTALKRLSDLNQDLISGARMIVDPVAASGDAGETHDLATVASEVHRHGTALQGQHKGRAEVRVNIATQFSDKSARGVLLSPEQGVRLTQVLVEFGLRQVSKGDMRGREPRVSLELKPEFERSRVLLRLTDNGATLSPDKKAQVLGSEDSIFSTVRELVHRALGSVELLDHKPYGTRLEITLPLREQVRDMRPGLTSSVHVHTQALDKNETA